MTNELCYHPIVLFSFKDDSVDSLFSRLFFETPNLSLKKGLEIRTNSVYFPSHANAPEE
jgi:hypothetical protein